MLLRWGTDVSAGFHWLIVPQTEPGRKEGIGPSESNPSLLKNLERLRDMPRHDMTSIKKILASVEHNVLALALDGDDEVLRAAGKSYQSKSMSIAKNAVDERLLHDSESSLTPAQGRGNDSTVINPFGKTAKMGKVRKKVLNEIAALSPFLERFEFNKKEGHRIQDFRATLLKMDPPIVCPRGDALA